MIGTILVHNCTKFRIQTKVKKKLTRHWNQKLLSLIDSFLLLHNIEDHAHRQHGRCFLGGNESPQKLSVNEEFFIQFFILSKPDHI